MRSSDRKIMTIDAARDWRRHQEGSVVFTNGVFDIVHPGHVEILERARAEGDCLIVAVNDDESARRLGKGTNRPVMSVQARMKILAAMEATDCVLAFTEDTPERVVGLLDPDVLVKGSDYENSEVPGSDYIRSRGGRLVFVPLVKGHSSSIIVETIRAATG